MNEIEIMTKTEQFIASTPLNIADPIQFGAEEYWCAMKVLDDMKVGRTHNGEELSLVGRIKLAIKLYRVDKMLDNDKIKMYLTEIVNLSAGWDDDGATGPKEPFCWETVARVAMDYARAALEEFGV